MKTCEVCGCSELETYLMTSSRKWNKILCGKHLQQLYRNGKITDSSKQIRNPKLLNNIKLYDNYAGIELYNKSGEVVSETFIDLEDVDACSKQKWSLLHINYVGTHIDNKVILLHSFVINNQYDCETVDHIDRNTLNNRKFNLRPATKSENGMNRKIHSNNTSGITGVSWDNKRNKWVSQIKINNINKRLGYFDDFDDAVNVRKKAEEKYFGEFNPK